MQKAWVPFEVVHLTTSSVEGVNVDNKPVEIQGITAARADIQAPFSFVTAGNTADGLDGTVRVARPCSILAVSAAAVGQVTTGTLSDPGVLWLGLGIMPYASATTPGVSDFPRLMASDAPGIWPYASPGRPVYGNPSEAVTYAFDPVQKGKRKLTPGWRIYAAAVGSASGFNVNVMFRVLFGFHG